MEEIRQIIINIVTIRGPINSVNLVLGVMESVNPVRFSEKEFNNTLQSLIESGEIIELEYINPAINYRVKSCFFPKGTKFPNLDSLHG